MANSEVQVKLTKTKIIFGTYVRYIYGRVKYFDFGKIVEKCSFLIVIKMKSNRTHNLIEILEL